MKRITKRILGIAAFCCAVSMTGCEFQKEVDATDPIVLSADELAEKFKTDEDAAEKECWNTVYKITGVVEKISSYSAVLKTTTTYEEDDSFTIEFRFALDYDDLIPDTIESGDIVTFKARYDDYYNGEIELEDAIYVSHEPSNKVTEEVTDEVIDETTDEQSTEESQQAEIEFTPEDVRSIIEISLQNNFENLNVDYDEDTECYNVSVWNDGVAAELAAVGNSDDWKNVVDSFVNLSIELQESVSDLHDGATTLLSLLNDQNLENTLLTVSDGNVMYNAADNSSGIPEVNDNNVSLGCQNALKAAKNYIDFSDFSYTGLIDQLQYEQYTYEEAVYGADNCGADWYEEAKECAENYLSLMAFSRQDLLDQLIYEGFTTEQAEYAVTAVGY